MIVVKEKKHLEGMKLRDRHQISCTMLKINLGNF